MKTELVKLSQVKVNAENPRTITNEKFNKLINSILVLPKMLALRPIVVDSKMVALGGNMRTNALREIEKMGISAITDRLMTLADFLRKEEGERKTLVEYWAKWLEQPTVAIINASELSEDERKQFVIKDNVSFGQWDYDALANKWDNAKLGDWGLDVWNTSPAAFAPIDGTPSATGSALSASDTSDGGDANEQFDGALPKELQGVDINPDNLPKIEGTDETAMERVIIVYKKEQLPELQCLLGIEINKVVYRLDEILPTAPEE